MGAACVTLQILCPGCIVQLQVGGGGRVAKVTGAAPSGYPTTDKEQCTPPPINPLLVVKSRI